MVHNSSFACGKAHRSCSGNCSLAHQVSVHLPQLHLDLKPCSEKWLTGSPASSYTDRTILHLSPHPEIKGGPGFHSSGAKVLATLPHTRESTWAQCRCSKPKHICSLRTQLCRSCWGTATASCCSSLHLRTPVVILSTALLREGLPRGC